MKKHTNIEQTKILYWPDDDTLVLLIPFHVVVWVVTNGEYVGREFPDLFVSVLLDLFRCVDREDLVRVDSHQNWSSVCLIKIKEINTILYFIASHLWRMCSNDFFGHSLNDSHKSYLILVPSPSLNAVELLLYITLPANRSKLRFTPSRCLDVWLLPIVLPQRDEGSDKPSTSTV